MPTKLHNLCEGCSTCCEFIITMISPHEESLEFHKAWGNGGPVKDEAGNLWVSIHKPCQHLKEDGFCDDYENRPQRCRKHPVGPSILFWDTCALMRDKFKREE